VTLIGFVILFAGAGVAGYFLGRFHDAPNRPSTQTSRSGRRRSA